MADQLLRHKPTGVIFISQPAFEQRADFEPYTPPEEQAPAPEPVARAPRAPRAPKPAEPPVVTPPIIDEAALSADASRNLPA
jgi:hypothetical protein